MLVLIDESGCAGFKLDKSSSPFFTLGMVIFSNLQEAEKVGKRILELKNDLRINNEFKFSKTHPNIKDKFFSVVSDYDFTVRALVVDNKKITSEHLKLNHSNFYNYFLKILLEYDEGVLRGATIKIDGRGGKTFKRSLNSYLRNQIGKDKIKKINFIDSKKDSLIQLADMVVGAIARANHQHLKNSDRWLKKLENAGKIDNIWPFK